MIEISAHTCGDGSDCRACQDVLGWLRPHLESVGETLSEGRGETAFVAEIVSLIDVCNQRSEPAHRFIGAFVCGVLDGRGKLEPPPLMTFIAAIKAAKQRMSQRKLARLLYQIIDGSRLSLDRLMGYASSSSPPS